VTIAADASEGFQTAHDSSLSTAATGPSRSDARSTLQHLPGLDGLRGFAVLAVLAFHGGFSWAVGGYLGVSLFFTLSGFLICRLLVEERATTGRIRLGRFWDRRFRRLAPAAFAALALIVVFGLTVATPSQRYNLSGDIRSALAYFANWHLYVGGQSYAAIFVDPSPVQHFWSLAIEEQFYLVFPLLVAGTLAVFRGSRRALAGVLLALACGSFALQLAFTNPDRIYYGTDTRALELLAGALLALALVKREPRVTHGNRAAWTFGTAAVFAAVVVAWFWHHLSQQSSWLYRGGFAVVAATSVVLILGAIAPGPVRTVCSFAPMRYVGRISYGLYLFHWPIFLWLDPVRVGLSGWPLFTVRCAATFALAAASFRLLEWPIRSRRVLGGWHFAPAFVASAIVIAISASVIIPRPASTEVITAADYQRASAAITAPPPPTGAVTIDHGTPRPMRVFVVGDSTGVFFAKGLADWGKRTGRAVVASDALIGCSVVRTGDYSFADPEDPTTHALSPQCARWPTEWTTDVASFKPDVILAVEGPLNTVDFRLPGQSNWQSILDPSFRSYLSAEMNHAVDVLSTAGVPIVWFDAPYSHRNLSPERRAERKADAFSRFDAYRALVAGLAANRPNVRYLHWARYFDSMSVDHDLALRPDGVHLLPARLGGLLDAWVWKAILADYRSASAAAKIAAEGATH
jgi:peptidoglycan/LPS O-acetylase OafA/YrhL